MIVKQENIDISIPSRKVCVVTMQPYIRFSTPRREPFRWSSDVIDKQLKAITRTLDLAQNGLHGSITSFTVFPEYSLPGLAGANIIEERIIQNKWPKESVIIAGVHGLNKAEYNTICEELALNVSDSDNPNSVSNGEWVNCCIIWIKEQDGRVRRWVQPKIEPSWPERNVVCHDMFKGSTIYLFKARYSDGYPCNFLTFICFDWIASSGNTSVRDEVLGQLNTTWQGNPTPLDWVFVIQHNEDPNHSLFLNSTSQFFNNINQYRFVERSQAVIFHANTAVSEHPCQTGNGAFTACNFSSNVSFDFSSCRPTVCMQTEELRNCNILRHLRCKDIVFREMGECIHIFEIRVPRSVCPDPSDRTYPIIYAEVHATYETDDPRLCGAPVPAAVKWINDSLDCISPFATNDLSDLPLSTIAETVQDNVVSEMRYLDAQIVINRINWATCSFDDGIVTRDTERGKNMDQWNGLENDSLEHIIHSLVSLGLAYNIEIKDSSLHGTLINDDLLIKIVAIRGQTHIDCRKHFDSYVPKTGVDPVLLITRDRDNCKITRRELTKYYETDNNYGLNVIDYQSLVTNCREAEDREALRRCLDELLPKECPII